MKNKKRTLHEDSRHREPDDTFAIFLMLVIGCAVIWAVVYWCNSWKVAPTPVSEPEKAMVEPRSSFYDGAQASADAQGKHTDLDERSGAQYRGDLRLPECGRITRKRIGSLSQDHTTWPAGSNPASSTNLEVMPNDPRTTDREGNLPPVGYSRFDSPQFHPTGRHTNFPSQYLPAKEGKAPSLPSGVGKDTTRGFTLESFPAKGVVSGVESRHAERQTQAGPRTNLGRESGLAMPPSKKLDAADEPSPSSEGPNHSNLQANHRAATQPATPSKKKSASYGWGYPTEHKDGWY